MTANKHTPAPWYVDPEEVTGGFRIAPKVGDRGLAVAIQRDAVPHIPGSGIDRATAEANARLIAATPELLEALSTKVKDAEQRVFEDWLESNSPSGDHEQVQRQWLESRDYRDFVAEWGDQLAAIAKATGGAA